MERLTGEGGGCIMEPSFRPAVSVSGAAPRAERRGLEWMSRPVSWDEKNIFAKSTEIYKKNTAVGFAHPGGAGYYRLDFH